MYKLLTIYTLESTGGFSMNEFALKLSAIITKHINFSLDIEKLKIYHKHSHNSSYNNIKEMVSLVEDLNSLGIKHQVFDGYIQTQVKA